MLNDAQHLLDLRGRPVYGAGQFLERLAQVAVLIQAADDRQADAALICIEVFQVQLQGQVFGQGHRACCKLPGIRPALDRGCRSTFIRCAPR